MECEGAVENGILCSNGGRARKDQLVSMSRNLTKIRVGPEEHLG